MLPASMAVIGGLGWDIPELAGQYELDQIDDLASARAAKGTFFRSRGAKLTGPGAARLEHGPMPLAGGLDMHIDNPVARSIKARDRCDSHIAVNR